MDFYLTALLQGLCLSGIALGIFISMKIFNIPDITTDGSYTLGGAITGVLLTSDLSASVTFLVVVCAGAIAGMLTGLIHTKLRVNPLLAGILVMTGLYSINLALMGRSNIPLINTMNIFELLNITESINANSLVTLILVVSLFIAIISYLLKSDYGITMRATGNSESMVKAMGVNTDRIKNTGLAFANALTASSGYLMTQFQGFADINMGIGIVIMGLGSVIIAETFINWQEIKSLPLSLVIVCGGAVVFQLVLAWTLTLGVDPLYLKLMTALFVLLIVSLPKLRPTRSG